MSVRLLHPVSGADTRMSNHRVVPERTGLHPAVEAVLQARGEVIGIDRRSQDSLGRLPVIKRADELQASPSSAVKTIVPAADRRTPDTVLSP